MSKERPILFSAPMVRAILEGRKTQTRRILRVQPLDVLSMKGDKAGIEWVGLMKRKPEAKGLVFRCKLGQPGDRLYVKETFRVSAKHDALPPRSLPFDRGMSIAYAAGGMMCRDEVGGPYVSHPNDELYDADWMGKTRVSIHMPRKASRITLEIVRVRVERLQDISYEDALAEGVSDFRGLIEPECQHGETADECARRLHWPQRSYRQLWESINGDGSWEANPWVWAIEFKRIEA